MGEFRHITNILLDDENGSALRLADGVDSARERGGHVIELAPMSVCSKVAWEPEQGVGHSEHLLFPGGQGEGGYDAAAGEARGQRAPGQRSRFPQLAGIRVGRSLRFDWKLVNERLSARFGQGLGLSL